MKKLMCVPNVSEGRDLELIEQLARVIRNESDVKLLEVSSDKDHNRTVFSYLGDPQAVLDATKKLAELTFELVDMTKHKGNHPRQGALDVVPFIPILDMESSEAIGIAKNFGKFVGSKGIPVYYYEDAATNPKRTNLVEIRKGQYESLPEKIKLPEWQPDEGPAKFVARTGSVQVAARFPLIAFNVNLRTENVEIANKISRALRHRNGGFRHVRGIGLSLEGTGMVQVSMNLTNYAETPIPRVMEAVRAEANRYGVAISGAELIGPVPMPALEEVVRHYLQVHDFSVKQIIESNLIE